MSRDYRKKQGNDSRGGGRRVGVGILIGLLLGLALALGVALYINKGPDPFVKRYRPATSGDAVVEAKSGGADSKPADSNAKPKTAKIEFDFYKILPGWEQAVTDKEFKRQTAAADKEVFYLQVAAFPDPAAADNLKARLALSGIESKIQTAELPDGKIWHRVRLGPFNNEDELKASREALKGLNLQANLIKVRQPG
jgi:cell division protein FtsN